MSLTILGGKFKGRSLKSPTGKTRPTLSILKKSLFDRIQTDIADSIFVDLFAGSGSIGLEAISRGAATCYFSEADAQTFKVLCENIKALKCESLCKPSLCKAHLQLKKLEKEGIQTDIIYIDPPYNIMDSNPSSYKNLLETLNISPIIKDTTLIFVENDSEHAVLSYLENCSHLSLIDTRAFCDSFLHLVVKK